MSYIGVKLPEFDLLVAKHGATADRLQQLAASLYGELSAAGLDTTPALRIREMAAKQQEETEDLRRRQRVVREMERLKINIGMSTPTGSVYFVSDLLTEA